MGDENLHRAGLLIALGELRRSEFVEGRLLAAALSSSYEASAKVCQTVSGMCQTHVKS